MSLVNTEIPKKKSKIHFDKILVKLQLFNGVLTDPAAKLNDTSKYQTPLHSTDLYWSPPEP
jgi:hypothetical protein